MLKSEKTLKIKGKMEWSKWRKWLKVTIFKIAYDPLIKINQWTDYISLLLGDKFSIQCSIFKCYESTFDIQAAINQ